MSPEKKALSVIWSHKGFFLLHALADAVWIALALSWFWLPDSKVWGLALAAIEALFLILAAFWLIGRALTWGTTIYLHRQDLPGVKISDVPWWLALGAIGFAVGVSLIAGLYPAARAARLSPVEALRYE